MSAAPEWPVGLARLAQALGRDLQRASRAVGGPEALWGAGRARLGGALRLSGAELEEALRLRAAIDVPADVARLADAGVTVVGLPDVRYPEGLRQLPDPPFCLFLRGGGADAGLARLAEGPAVGVVGSRRATAAGTALAHRLGADLARRGAAVVSGLAHGIDAAAHEGALAAGGCTVAVLGCGVDVPYPRRNRDLARRVAASGALVSEFWPGTPPAPWRFPARNRIVAGLSGGVAVVEAGVRSGALITADFALELGRPVLAVPGWPGALASEGCNGLLRAGAALLETVDDVVAELADAPWRPAGDPQAEAVPDGLAAQVHRCLAHEPMDADALAETLGADPGEVAGALALLEVEGLAVRGEGRRYWATPTRVRREGC
ncbi:MAG TPA: DNA-processing protein DprA [Miltoncostaeaceae bacterium]|nr:DNA-processing protein DprA [Miltoncostaeaceae bacterium]